MDTSEPLLYKGSLKGTGDHTLKLEKPGCIKTARISSSNKG